MPGRGGSGSSTVTFCDVFVRGGSYVPWLVSCRRGTRRGVRGSPDRSKQLGDLGRTRRTRICSGGGHRGGLRARRGPARARRSREAASKPPSRASSSTRSTGRDGRHRVGDDRGVEAHCRRQADRVHRAVRQPVGAADRLGHRVSEEEAARGERPSAVGARLRSPVRASRSRPVLEHPRKPAVDRAPPLRRAALRAWPGVQRLHAVRERVHGSAAALGARQIDRQLSVVHDRAQDRRRPAADLTAIRVAHSEVPRPLGAGVGGRDGDEREPGGRRGLAGIDRAATADGEDAVSPGGTTMRSDGTSLHRAGAGSPARPTAPRRRAAGAPRPSLRRRGA